MTTTLPLATDRDVILAVHRACETATTGIDDYYMYEVQDGICRAFGVSLTRDAHPGGGCARLSYKRGEAEVVFEWSGALGDWVEKP